MAKLSAVEFALCVLSMFGRVIDENRMAVQVLLEAIKSYNPLTHQFGKRAVKQAGYGGRSSLRALAAFFGKDYNMKELRTDEGGQAVLHTILDPVLGSLTRSELVKLREDVDEAIKLASSAPMNEVRARVIGFVRKAWEDGRREHWMAAWKAMKAQGTRPVQVGSNNHNQPTSILVEVPTIDSVGDFAVVPVISALKRRRRVPINRPSASFPSPVDVCLGRSSLSSNQPNEDYTPLWPAHGRIVLYPNPASSEEKALLLDFKFPPAGILPSTAPDTSSTAISSMDTEQTLEMSAKLRRWEDEWEKEQLGSWKAAIEQDEALWFIVECTRDKRIWHPHGWKKLDPTARSAHKKTTFKFPAPCSVVSPSTATATRPASSERPLETDAQYKKWEDNWETEQLGKWSAGLKMQMRKEEGGLWSRLAMAWKSERVDLWAGIAEEELEGVNMDSMDWTTSTTLATKLGRLFGLA
ncbi:unnamed protein product [Rhizoctonia solani]|uniref:Uncharacterized protein n=1 Tax=Rhizoctonia solani TaxID=456999 RepID=A0A8H3D6Q8_9AGAM|nr:unnamed protein product [Rhizoctonia solani]